MKKRSRINLIKKCSIIKHRHLEIQCKLMAFGAVIPSALNVLVPVIVND